MPPPKKPAPKGPSLAERLDKIKINPLAPTLSDYAPGGGTPQEKLEAAARIEEKVAVPGGRPPRLRPSPTLIAGQSTIPRPESPLAIKLLRLPGKPSDALNTYLRRIADERKWGSSEETAIREAVAAGWRAFVDLNRDVPPTAIRATLGIKAGESSRLSYNLATIADYLISAKIDPVNLAAGPAAKLLGKTAQRVPAVARGVAKIGKIKGSAVTGLGKAATAAERAVLGEVGSFRSQVAAHTIGVGPTARMIRAARGAYEPEVGTRFKEAEAIAKRMQDWVMGRRRIDPAFSKIAEEYRRLHPGRLDPLTDAVRMYIRANQHKGQTLTSKSIFPAASTPRLDPAREAATRAFAAAHRIPWDRVEEFGEAMIQHGEETVASLIRSGANPFEGARGLQVKKALGPNLPKWLQTHFAGVPTGAVERSQDRLRRHWFNYYVEDLLPKATKAEGGLHTLGPAGIRVGRGKHGEVLEGVQSIRRAGMRNLITGLRGSGEYLRTWAPGTDVPRGWVVVTNSQSLPGEVTRVPWTRGMDFVRDTMMPETLWNYMAGEMAQFLPTVSKAGRIVGVEGLFGQKTRSIAGGVARAVGAQKRAWITNPATWITNAVGNHLLVETRLSREGVPTREFLANLKASAGEALHFEKTSQMSPDIRSMSGHTRAFLESIAEGAGVRIEKTGEQAAGVAGKRVDLGRFANRKVGPARLPQAVFVPDPGFDQVSALGLRRPVAMAAAAGKTAALEGERLLSALGSVHGLSERTYKLAMFKTLLPRMGAKRAAKVVEETLFDYSDRPAMLEILDRYGILVFNAFPTFALKNTLETFVHRPDLVARYPRLARLSQIETGADVAAGEMDQGDRPSHLVGLGPGKFLDPSRMFPMAGPIDWLSRPGESLGREDLSRLPGRTAFSPIIEQALNRKLYAGIDRASPIVPEGTPPSLSPLAEAPLLGALTGEEGDLRIREFLNSVLPGGVRGAGRVARAEEGIATGRGALSTPQTTPEALLQAVLGLRTYRVEDESARADRGGDLAGRRFGVLSDVIDQEESALEATGAPNPYMGEARKIGREEDVDRAITAADQYLDGLAPQSVSEDGHVTEDGRRRIREAVKWRAALMARLEELGRQTVDGRR